jgi:hypothetical protein
MDQSTVRNLEDEIEEAIEEMMAKLGPKHLPFRPSKKTMHLMAKAAVTIYEAAAENRRVRRD